MITLFPRRRVPSHQETAAQKGRLAAILLDDGAIETERRAFILEALPVIDTADHIGIIYNKGIVPAFDLKLTAEQSAEKYLRTLPDLM